jgi:hypothetical protein
MLDSIAMVLKWTLFFIVMAFILYFGVSVMNSRESFEQIEKPANAPVTKTPLVPAVKKLPADATNAQLIVRTFRDTLERMPTEQELRYYVHEFEGQPFNEETMIRMLQDTEESRRLTLLQKNDVTSMAVQRIPKARVDDGIQIAYLRIFGKAPSTDLMPYLRQRYNDGGASDDAFETFLQSLLALEQQIGNHPADAIGNAARCYNAKGDQALANAQKKRAEESLNVARKVCCDAALRDHADSDWGKIIPGFEWAVPHPRPPICTPCGTPCTVVGTTDQTSLIGTLLNDAADTQVGSLMPKFEYKEQKTCAQCGRAN